MTDRPVWNDVRLGGPPPMKLDNIVRGHEVSAWKRAKDATLGPGPTPPRKWSWEGE